MQQCWDPQGNVYNVPLYCYSYPSNMIEREVEVIETKHEGPVVDVELRIRLSASVRVPALSVHVCFATLTILGNGFCCG